MKVACIQSEIFKTREECYTNIENLIRNLMNGNKGVDIVCLPERWLPFFTELNKNIQKERGESYNFLRKIAQKYKIHLLSGAIWEIRKPSEKPWITCYYFDDNGKEIGRQDKMHLYSFEKQNFQNSNTLHIFKIEKFKFSILICFDMAFFETPRIATMNGAEILFSPTQIRKEGMYNWNIYLQARVLENRIPVVAVNSFGEIGERKFIGKSKIITFTNGFFSPSKLKILEAPSNKSSFICSDIDLKFPNKLRKIRLNERIDMKNIEIVHH
ncbi:MAG: carbon-nitrogen hydrolase family protein [Candidatus Lokiarchaeota archaeon]